MICLNSNVLHINYTFYHLILNIVIIIVILQNIGKVIINDLI